MTVDTGAIDRRRDNVFKNIVVPVVVAVITGTAAAYMATTVTIAVHGNRLDYLEKDVGNVKVVLREVSQTNVEMARRSEWMRNTEKTIDSILGGQRILQEQTRDRYTRGEAEKDLNLIDRRLDRLEGYHK